MSYCLFLHNTPVTKECLIYVWEVKLCPERPWKPKSWCNEGLAKAWPEFYPSCGGFPGSEPRYIGSKGKRKFHGCCPLGQLYRGAEHFSTHCHFLHIFQEHISHWSMCFGAAVAVAEQLCVRAEFRELKMKVFLLTCFLWSLMHPSLNAFCSEENRLSQFNIMQGQQKT